VRRALAVLTLAALAAAGCSDREHLNPLDPENVRTSGAPQAFAALAGNGAVLLRWQPPPNGLVAGFRLYRGVGSATPEPYVDLPEGSTGFSDSPLVNGVDVHYRLAYLTNGSESAAASDVATPGPVQAWVADAGITGATGSIAKLTADGRHVLESVTARLQHPSAIDVDFDATVWVADPSGHRLWRVREGADPEEVGSLVQPIAVRVDRARRRTWVADPGRHELQSFDVTNIVSPRTTTAGFENPIDVALDAVDGSVWVCDYAADRVQRVGAGGAGGGFARAVDPVRAAVDTVTRRVWVTSYHQHRISVFALDGTPVDSFTVAAGPVSIAIDGARGYVWVCDEATDTVFQLDRTGTVRFRVRVPAPFGVAVDPTTGDAWLVLGTTPGAVERLAATNGQVISRLSGFLSPASITLLVP
jgi:hypothetical protein